MQYVIRSPMTVCVAIISLIQEISVATLQGKRAFAKDKGGCDDTDQLQSATDRRYKLEQTTANIVERPEYRHQREQEERQKGGEITGKLTRPWRRANSADGKQYSERDQPLPLCH